MRYTAFVLWSLSMVNAGAALYAWHEIYYDEKRGAVAVSAILAVIAFFFWI